MMFMDDLEYQKFYWEFVDEQEDILQSYIYGLDISDVVNQVFQRFSDVDLNSMLSVREVARLHKQIEIWLKNGLDEKSFHLLLKYFENKKRIRQRESLSLWILAALCIYYQRILQKSMGLFYQAARHNYQAIWKASGFGKKGYSPPEQKEIEALMKDINPAFGMTLTQRLWADARYYHDVLLSRYHTLVLNGKRFHPDSPVDKKRFEKIEDVLLKRSNKTKEESNGHHGVMDKQMAFIIGYTVLKAFEDSGVDRYRFIAVMDGRTTDSCKNLNGKVFSISEAKLGVNVPPIANPPHPCRSVIRSVEE